MSEKPKYAWDTSVFLAWLTDDATAPLADIHAVAQDVDNGDAILIVSPGAATPTAHWTCWQGFEELQDGLSVPLGET